MALRPNPFIYEINTWVWLTELSQVHGRALSLANLPEACIEQIAAWHPDAVWLMGVWERSPHGRQIALQHPGLQFEFQRVLPDYTPDDIVGSPYAVHRYVVDTHLGGPEGLAAFRAQLRERDIALILDYVPNHVAVDHAWAVECPACLMRGTQADLEARPASYYKVPENGEVIAHGRDPYWPAWTDTAQVNAFSPEGRQKSLQTVLDIAHQCDGVRCDMAMLLVNHVFAQTWNITEVPDNEFWTDVIPQVKHQHPAFTFMAEVYWDMEADMQALGFDYTYDKRLYDRLLHEPVYTVRDHLLAASVYQRKMVRFVENHDEARAADSFGVQKSLAAAVLTMILPGAKLVHEGQFEGRTIRVPVQMARRPAEKPDQEVLAFYRKLMDEISSAPHHNGVFMTLASQAILGADTGHENLFAFAWALGADWRLAIINYSADDVKGRIMLPRQDFAGMKSWTFTDVLNPGTTALYNGDDLLTSGLPVELPAYGAHLFTVKRD